MAIERDQVDSDLFTVDSTIIFSKWACFPDRTHCTPDRSSAEEKSPGQFHLILPAASEWSISVPDVEGKAKIHAAQGTVCLGPDMCVGPQGQGTAAGPGFLEEDKPVGALILKVIDGAVIFRSITGRERRFATTKGISSLARVLDSRGCPMRDGIMLRPVMKGSEPSDRENRFAAGSPVTLKLA